MLLYGAAAEGGCGFTTLGASWVLVLPVVPILYICKVYTPSPDIESLLGIPVVPFCPVGLHDWVASAFYPYVHRHTTHMLLWYTHTQHADFDDPDHLLINILF